MWLVFVRFYIDSFKRCGYLFILQRVEIPSKESIKLLFLVWLFAQKYTLVLDFVQTCQKSTVRHDFMGCFVTGLYNGMVTIVVDGR